MKYGSFIERVQNLPVVESANLPGVWENGNARVQLSRWGKAGKLVKLKRGLYVLPQPFRKIELFEPYLASLLIKPSYLSLEKALEYHDLIPETVSVFTCVTTKNPARFNTPVGTFEYHHLRTSLFWGYQSVTVNKQTAFVASPEKCLLDLFYLRPVEVTPGYLEELRLQNLEKIDLERLASYARNFSKPKIIRAAKCLQQYMESHWGEEKTL